MRSEPFTCPFAVMTAYGPTRGSGMVSITHEGFASSGRMRPHDADAAASRDGFGLNALPPHTMISAV